MASASPSETASTDATYKVAYDEGVRGLDEQERAMSGLWTRAGTMVSAAAIATSFLGGQALRDGGSSVWTWLAIGAFVALGICAIGVLWPQSSSEFSAAPRPLIDAYLEGEEPVSLAKLYRELALHMDTSAAMNTIKLRWATYLLRAVAILLVVEVGFWVVDLIA